MVVVGCGSCCCFAVVVLQLQQQNIISISSHVATTAAVSSVVRCHRYGGELRVSPWLAAPGMEHEQLGRCGFSEPTTVEAQLVADACMRVYCICNGN